jgi:hypothetical protein
MGLCVAYGALICRFRALAVYIVLIIRSLRLTQVLPYCILNCCIMALLEWLHSFDNIDLAISDKGHSFMNLMVAFLTFSLSRESTLVSVAIMKHVETWKSCIGKLENSCRMLVSFPII